MVLLGDVDEGSYGLELGLPGVGYVGLDEFGEG